MSGPNTVIQYSFSTGEVSPGIRNRRDWARIDGAVAEMLNGIVMPTGGSRKRPGMRLVEAALHDDKPIRLVKFEFSKDQVYELEFGDYQMRFYLNRGLILDGTNNPYVLATPYSAEQAQSFTFAQERDAMFFAHWDIPLKQLVRYGHANWVWSNVFNEEDNRLQSPGAVTFFSDSTNGHNGYEYAVTAYAIEAGTPKESVGFQTIISDPSTIDFIGEVPQNSIQSCVAWVKKYAPSYGSRPGFPTYPAAMDLSDITEDSQYPTIGNYVAGAGNLNIKLFTIFQAVYPSLWGAGRTIRSFPPNPGSYYCWQLVDGISFATLALFPYMSDNSGVLPEYSGQVGGPYNTWLMLNKAINYINSNVSVAGYTKSGIYNSIISFVNNYNNANSSKPGNRIKWHSVSDSSGYYVYRRPIGAQDKNFYRIATIVDGATDYEDVDVTETTVENVSPIEGQNSFTAPDMYPRIVTFYQQRMVLGCTKQKPTTIFGSRTGIYTDYTINPTDLSSGYEFKMASEQSNPLEAILALYTLVVLTSGGDFISTTSGAMNAGNVNFNQKSYNGASSVTPIIVGDTGLYVPLNQQTIRAITYSYEKDGFAQQNILFSAQHLTQDKKVTCLAFQRDPINIIWAVLDDGSLISCFYIPEQDFLAWSHHETQGKVQSINVIPTTAGNDELWVVVKRTLGDGTVKQYIEVLEDMRPYGTIPNNETAFYVDSGLSAKFDAPTREIMGLEHLEGLTVSILADFAVEPQQIVRNGAITLQHEATDVHVGLPYLYRLKTINMELINQGTLRTTRSNAYSGVIEVQNCRELLYSANNCEPNELIVHDADNLRDPQLVNGDIRFLCRAAETRGAYMTLTSPNPVPCEILSIVAEIDRGDS